MKDHQLNLSDRFSSAIDYARHLHIERRKGTQIPFMAHLLGVASLVMGEAGQVNIPVTEDMVIAALLHDAAEDYGGANRLEDIRHNFGENVARMVEGLSDTLVEDASQKEDWDVRKAAYLKRLSDEPADVQLISAADKLYNARTMLDEHRAIGHVVWQRFKRGRDQQLGYFRSLVKILKTSGHSRIVNELERVVTQLDKISANDPA